MTQKEIMKYAIKGLALEIEMLDDTIRRGQQILSDRAAGNKKDKSPRTDEEIRQIIEDKKIKMEDLESKRTVLIWEIATTKAP